MQNVTVTAITKTSKGHRVELSDGTKLNVGAAFTHIVLMLDGGYSRETGQNDGWCFTRHKTVGAAQKMAAEHGADYPASQPTVIELATWAPAEQVVAELPAEPTSFAAQTRRNADAAWVTIAVLPVARDAANTLRDTMETAGFRYGELSLHVDDLIVGHTLTADNGRGFRLADAELVAHDCGGAAGCCGVVSDTGWRSPVGTGTVVERADRATVARVHGADVADFVAERYPSALPLLADGWTVDSALAHVDGSCDRALCTGEHGDERRAKLAELGWDDAQIDAAIAAAEHAVTVSSGFTVSAGTVHVATCACSWRSIGQPSEMAARRDHAEHVRVAVA